MLSWLKDFVVWCVVWCFIGSPERSPIGNARFCAQCWAWLSADDQGRFERGGEMLAAVCEPCIHRLARIGAEIIREQKDGEQ
jgi:hypothetical protein